VKNRKQIKQVEVNTGAKVEIKKEGQALNPS
jgi:hypothetical protein